MNDTYNFASILIVFIAVIVGLALIPTMASFVGTGVNTVTATNATYTAGADGVIIDLTGQELIGTPVVTNATGGETVVSSNYTIDEGVSATTGLKTVRYTTTTGSVFAGESVNISYNYGADGYIENSGGRSIASLIVIFACLAVAAVSLYPVLKDKILDM